ncbi:carbon-nitrogen hydrolase, partial [Moraxella catarrhalis]|nr:carbon-nitrogen hydrolase [Moraxella catarrhalis]
DSQCLIIGSAQGGIHQIGSSIRQTWGHSMLVNAHGQLIADRGRNEAAANGYCIAYADYDAERQAKIRAALPIFDCHHLA